MEFSDRFLVCTLEDFVKTNYIMPHALVLFSRIAKANEEPRLDTVWRRGSIAE